MPLTLTTQEQTDAIRAAERAKGYPVYDPKKIRESISSAVNIVWTDVPEEQEEA